MTQQGLITVTQLATWKESLIFQSRQLDELILLQDRKKEEFLFYLENIQSLDNIIVNKSKDAIRTQGRLEEQQINHAIASLRSYREKLLNYLSLLAPGAASQSSLVDEQDALDLTSDVHKFLTALIKQTSDLLHDTYVDDSFTNYMSDPPSLIPSAMSQSGFDENLSQQLTFKAVSEQESCPLMFGLPPYLTPSTVPLSLTVPSFNLYAFTIPNFTHSTEYDSYVESPSFMTPPFPFKFKLRVWPKGFAQADSPTDIGAAIVLQKGFSRNVEEFAPKLFPTRTTPDTATNTVQNLYTFDLRIEMLSEYPEKAKQSVQFPFRKQKTQECKIGKGSGWTSFIKKQEVVDGRLMWKENMAAHFLFGWRFPNYKRMTEAYHLSYIEQNQYLIPEDDSIN